MEQIAAEYAGRATFVKVNVDDFSDIAKEFNVSGIPVVFVVGNGEIGDPIVGGGHDDSVYKELVDAVIAGPAQ